MAGRTVASRPVASKYHELECGHTCYIESFVRATNQFDVFFCRKCDAPKLLKGIIHEWSFKCAHCSYSRRYGQARINCELAAVRHRTSKRGKGHMVTIMFGPKVVHTFGENTLPLPYSEYPEECPF